MSFKTLSKDEARKLLAEELQDVGLIRLGLSRPLPGSSYRKGQVRRVKLGEDEVWQLALQTATQEFHRNLAGEQAGAELWSLWWENFEQLHLFGVTQDLQFKRQQDGSLRLQRTRPSTKGEELTVVEHNREKEYLLREGTPIPFLIEIGVMNAQGKVLAAKYHKFRQINRFVEMVHDVTREIPRDRPLRLVDFGSGKSYLTFAIHYLFKSVQQRSCLITGVDRNPEVIATCRKVAEKLGLVEIDFEVGEIGKFPWDESIDVVVSLHACDTATDDVLGAAAVRKIPVILSAPCCQHELAGQLANPAWNAFLQHGILRERLGALGTDALRAAALEVLGYETQLLEFVDLEHTPKNLLIRAVLHRTAGHQQSEKIASYRALRQALGIQNFHLEQKLGPEFQNQM